MLVVSNAAVFVVHKPVIWPACSSLKDVAEPDVTAKVILAVPFDTEMLCDRMAGGALLTAVTSLAGPHSSGKSV